jgi:Leucine-rich repeat (LRR) protein
MGSNKLSYFRGDCESLEYLDLSFNNLTYFDLALCENLKFLDLSHNLNLHHLNLSNNLHHLNLSNYLQILNLSNTNTQMILNLRFSPKSNLTEIDLSLNNLSNLRVDYFSNLKKLTSLSLSDNILEDYRVLNSISNELTEINLSRNPKFGDFSLILNQFNNIETLTISNTNLRSFSFSYLMKLSY